MDLGVTLPCHKVKRTESNIRSADPPDEFDAASAEAVSLTIFDAFKTARLVELAVSSD